MSARYVVALALQPMNTEPQAYSIREFVCKWMVLMNRVMALPNYEEDIKGRLFLDIMNEPDSMGIQWEPANNKPGARELYLQTMDALHELSPEGSEGWLYIVEGTGQNMFGLNWVSMDWLQVVVAAARQFLLALGTKRMRVWQHSA